MKILIASGSRADKPMLQSIERELIKKEIQTSWYNIITESLGVIDSEDAKATLETIKPTHVFVLGDRWEVAEFCLIAIVMGIEIIHQGGGEVSQGAYDDIFRDWISRAASVHFVIDARCFNNLTDRGIRQNVYLCGSPRMDYEVKINSREIVYQLLRLDPKKKTALLIYHPATLGGEDPKEIISALKKADLQIMSIRCNTDRGSDEIDELFKLNFEHHYYTVDHSSYVNLLANCDIMIGNSSAGITEAVSYKVPVVNIGDRQKGRSKPNNVIDCRC